MATACSQWLRWCASGLTLSDECASPDLLQAVGVDNSFPFKTLQIGAYNVMLFSYTSIHKDAQKRS